MALSSKTCETPQSDAQIQDQGALILVDCKTFEILAVSENILDFTSCSTQNLESLLEYKLLSLFNNEDHSTINLLLERTQSQNSSYCQINSPLAGQHYFISSVKCETGIILSIEVELNEEERESCKDKPCFLPLLPFHQLARRAIDKLHEAPSRDVNWLCETAVTELHTLSGYEHVMIAQVYDEDYSQIIAESCSNKKDSLKGKYIPSPSIPDEWVNEYYQHHIPMRFIHDTSANQIPLMFKTDFTSSFSLSSSILQGVDAFQLDLLRSRGIRSLLSMPIVLSHKSKTKLWGLILFLNYSSTYKMPCSHRGACTFVVQALRAHLTTSSKSSERAVERNFLSLQTTICDRLTYQVPAALITESPSIMDLVPCDGIALVNGVHVVQNGVCPTEAQIQNLVAWAEESKLLEDGNVFHTQNLFQSGFSDALSFPHSITGAILCTLSSDYILLWFRKKAEVSLDWAWMHPSISGIPSPNNFYPQNFNEFAIKWTEVEINAIKGFQKLCQEALKGNSEPMKTMILVRMNEERLRAMQDLAIVARDLGRMMEIAKTPIFSINKNMIISEWNQRMVELTGRSKDSVIGKPLSEILSPDHLEEAKQKIKEAFLGKAHEYLELVFQTSIQKPPMLVMLDGDRVKPRKRGGKGEEGGEEEHRMVLMVTISPQRDSLNEVVGASLIGQDITEQKKMMKRCEDGNTSEYKEIVDKSDMPIWGVDGKGHIVEWNHAMVKTTGITRDQALGKSLVGELVGHEKVLMVPDKDMLLSLEFAIHRAIAGHEMPLVTFKFVNDEGRCIDSVLNMNVRKDKDTGATQVLCFMEDVTMRRAMEKAMAVRLAAEAASDAKTRHLAFLCHEIRNPLNGILGNISFMEDTSLTEEQKELVETTATCGYQLRKIVEDVLNISQMEEGKVDLEFKELNLQRIINAVISQVGIAASKKGLQLYSTIDPKARSYRPFGDAPRLQQVLSNFAWNAVKFTNRGWVELSIGVDDLKDESTEDLEKKNLTEEGGRTMTYYFRVADSGEGIPESLHRRLFEQYSTGKKASSSQYGGTGLGLSICQQLAAVMGGEIKCQSQVGKGSIFTLVIDLEVLPSSSKSKSSTTVNSPSSDRSMAAGKESGVLSSPSPFFLNPAMSSTPEPKVFDPIADESADDGSTDAASIQSENIDPPFKRDGKVRERRRTKEDGLGASQSVSNKLRKEKEIEESLNVAKDFNATVDDAEILTDVDTVSPPDSTFPDSEMVNPSILSQVSMDNASNGFGFQLPSLSVTGQSQLQSDFSGNPNRISQPSFLDVSHFPEKKLSLPIMKNSINRPDANVIQYPSSVHHHTKNSLKLNSLTSSPSPSPSLAPLSIPKKKPSPVYDSKELIVKRMNSNENTEASKFNFQTIPHQAQTSESRRMVIPPRLQSSCSIGRSPSSQSLDMDSERMEEDLISNRSKSPSISQGDNAVTSTAAAISKEHGKNWHFRVIREIITVESVAVLGELTINDCSRQSWGIASCNSSLPSLSFLQLATSISMQEASKLFQKERSKFAINRAYMMEKRKAGGSVITTGQRDSKVKDKTQSISFPDYSQSLKKNDSNSSNEERSSHPSLLQYSRMKSNSGMEYSLQEKSSNSFKGDKESEIKKVPSFSNFQTFLSPSISPSYSHSPLKNDFRSKSEVILPKVVQPHPLDSSDHSLPLISTSSSSQTSDGHEVKPVAVKNKLKSKLSFPKNGFSVTNAAKHSPSPSNSFLPPIAPYSLSYSSSNSITSSNVTFAQTQEAEVDASSLKLPRINSVNVGMPRITLPAHHPIPQHSTAKLFSPNHPTQSMASGNALSVSYSQEKGSNSLLPHSHQSNPKTGPSPSSSAPLLSTTSSSNLSFPSSNFSLPFSLTSSSEDIPHLEREDSDISSKSANNHHHHHHPSLIQENVRKGYGHSSGKENSNKSADVEKSPKVLIVDDEPVNVMVIKRALDKAKFEVVTGSDGTDVIEKVIENREHFDALLLDERLKVMNGSEACLRVREYEHSRNLPETPIIAISANVEPDDLKKYAMVGYSAVMGKPINVRTVGERLKKFLSTHKQLPALRRDELKRVGNVKVKKMEDIVLFS